jgi:translation elongation factor EF-1alpha
VLCEQVGWDKERFDQIVKSLTTFLQSSGFRLKNLWFVPLSGLTGANLEKKVDASECAWYTGPSLVDAIGTTWLVLLLKPCRSFTNYGVSLNRPVRSAAATDRQAVPHGRV